MTSVITNLAAPQPANPKQELPAVGGFSGPIKEPAPQPPAHAPAPPPVPQPPTLPDFEQYRTGDKTWRNIPYGPATWTESGLQHQYLDLDLPDAGFAAIPLSGIPLVVWFHANGSTKTVPGSGPLHDAKDEILAAGFAFAAVDFRHPVVNVDEGAPHNDCGLAIQMLRAMATAFGLDKLNFYGLAKSRGSLCLWQALAPDLANGNGDTWQKRQSSLLKGVWTHAAQTTYSTTEFANLFILEAERAAFLVAFPDDVRWGSSIQLADTSNHRPFVTILHADPYPTGLVHANEVDEHYSGFGSAFRDAYLAEGLGAKITAQDEIDDADAYIGAVDWFVSLLSA